MSKIYNSDVTKGLAKNAGIQINVDKVPNELAEKIVPTFETNPELLRKTTISRTANNSTSTNSVCFTSNPNKDFYLTGVAISYSKDATSTGTQFWIQTTINGATTYVLRLAGLAGVAENQFGSLTFPPLKIDRGADVKVFCDSWAANQRMCGSIVGYEVETSNA